MTIKPPIEQINKSSTSTYTKPISYNPINMKQTPIIEKTTEPKQKEFVLTEEKLDELNSLPINERKSVINEGNITTKQQNLPLSFAYAMPIIAIIMIISLFLIGYVVSYGAFAILIGSALLAIYAWYGRVK